MKQIFIKNIETSNKGFLIRKTDDSVFTNQGPEGAVSTNGDLVNLCLAPQPNVPEAQSDLSNPIQLEGKFVVEVNGEIVPYAFNADDLHKYFNLDDRSGTGVAFILEPEKARITCSTGTSIFVNAPDFRQGLWEIKIGGELLGQFEDGYAIQDFLNEHPEYGVTYQVFPSWGGGSGTPETQGLWTNHGDVGVTLEIRSVYEFPVSYHSHNFYSGNEYVSIPIDGLEPLDYINLAVCLNAYSPIHDRGVAITFNDDFDYRYNEVTVTTPDGESHTGVFESASYYDDQTGLVLINDAIESSGITINKIYNENTVVLSNNYYYTTVVIKISDASIIKDVISSDKYYGEFDDNLPVFTNTVGYTVNENGEAIITLGPKIDQWKPVT